MDLPRWIRTPADLEDLARSLAGAGSVAIDTEADSLHHYPGKLCLVQIADDAGRAHLVDPLALPSLSALGRLFATPPDRRPGDLRAQRRAAPLRAARAARR